MIPVDMPLLDAAALRLLAGACRDAAVRAGRPAPVRGRRDARCPRSRPASAACATVLDGLDTALVELEDDLLANVNTPADLDTLAR